MSSNSHASFSSRITEAEKLNQDLGTFTDYAPGDPELMAPSLEADITALEVIQEEHTQKNYAYSQAAAARRTCFEKEPNSIGKLLSPIGSNVKAKFGKASTQYKQINSLIGKIRGEKPVTVNLNSNEDTISQCENSYGSQLVYFKDIITLLILFGTDYAPANTAITIPELQGVLAAATSKTNTVTTTLALYKPLIKARQVGFDNLHEKAQAIKNMVKSQYTLDSYEYNLIKGLKI